MRRLGGLAVAGTVIAGAMVATAAPAAAITFVISSPAAGPLTAATVGTAYTQTFTAANGTTPYTWIVLSGALPPGLTLTTVTDQGNLSGTPTSAGDYSFTIKVTDAATSFDTHAYTLHVNAIAPGAPTGVTATAGPLSQQATVSFTPPASTGGSPITGYVAISSPGGFTSSGCTASPCTVNGLTNGTPYTFIVTATNIAGTGPSGGPSGSVTPLLGQAITFVHAGPDTFGTTPTLTATSTGTSGNPVTFTSSTAPVCTVTTGGQLTFVSVGTCTIKADQAGNATHLAAPTVTQTFAVQKAKSTVTVTSNANPSVFGQPLTFTATLTNPVATTGTVAWTVNAAAGVGTSSALSATGTATFTPTTPLAVGSYTVTATYTPLVSDTTHDTNSGQITQVVGKASTTTAVQVSGDTLTATVAPVAPGVGTPTGTVAFTVNGIAAGSAPVGAGGIATFAGSGVGNQAVAATYSGDANFLTSSGNRTKIAPTVKTHVSSAHAKHNGWYRSPVHVSFTCTANTAPLSAPCPGTVTKSQNGAGQSVTRTVTATDGGTTTVSVSPINIDGTAPQLKVKEKGNRVTCHAHDSLSGGASCKVTRTSSTTNGVKTVHWTATAHDRAGNTKKKHGHFSFTV